MSLSTRKQNKYLDIVYIRSFKTYDSVLKDVRVQSLL